VCAESTRKFNDYARTHEDTVMLMISADLPFAHKRFCGERAWRTWSRCRPCARMRLPEVSELDAVRHYTRLSQLNFSIDTHFYPLGSCTMKYNPRACNTLAMLPQFLGRHPLAPDETGPGLPRLHVGAAGDAAEVTGMKAACRWRRWPARRASSPAWR
jgi:hypothetical protein